MLFLFAGLGNPGDMYVGTRHNVGRDFLLSLARAAGFGEWNRDKYAGALITSGHISRELGSPQALFVLPETYMNRSGDAIRKCASKHNIPFDNIVLIHDDIDLPIGAVRVSKGRGSGGHNGVQSVINALGTKHFVRVRIGICPVDKTLTPRKPARTITSDYVLKPFLPDEEAAVIGALEKAREALVLIADRGVHAAMERINRLG
jgi:PTH1 family peptidyl-tRNA hydrolase